MVQYPVASPASPASAVQSSRPIPGSLAYNSSADTNPEPFILSPILNLPPSFGSAYVGETFSCTLCANHDVPDVAADITPATKFVRDVRIEAEMKTPSSLSVVKLELGPNAALAGSGASGIDLEPGQTVQRIVNFDLKEEGNHVLVVTVSYYEATDTSGRTRTFRKLYQFICKASLIVRTKAGSLPRGKNGRRWVLEAQLENCGEDAIQLERVSMDLDVGLTYADCNGEWTEGRKPVLHPGEVEQVCFAVGETGVGVEDQADGRLLFGALDIGWRSEMGNKGFLSTGRLGTRSVK